METTPEPEKTGYEDVAKKFEVTVYSSWENPNSLIGLNEQTSRDGITTETSMIDYEASNNMHLLEEPREYEKAIKASRAGRDQIRRDRNMPDDDECEGIKCEERAKFEEAITVRTVYELWKPHGCGSERALKGHTTLAEP